MRIRSYGLDKLGQTPDGQRHNKKCPRSDVKEGHKKRQKNTAMCIPTFDQFCKHNQKKKPNVKKKTNKCITARNFVFDTCICIQMADKILIPENCYTALSKTIKIYFKSKQTK